MESHSLDVYVSRSHHAGVGAPHPGGADGSWLQIAVLEEAPAHFSVRVKRTEPWASQCKRICLYHLSYKRNPSSSDMGVCFAFALTQWQRWDFSIVWNHLQRCSSTLNLCLFPAHHQLLFISLKWHEFCVPLQFCSPVGTWEVEILPRSVSSQGFQPRFEDSWHSKGWEKL